MRSNALTIGAVVIIACVYLSPPPAGGQAIRVATASTSASPASEPASLPASVEQALDAWRRMQKAEADSSDFIEARGRLTKLIEQAPASDRPQAAAALMNVYAPDHINATAVGLFGQDPFDASQIRRIVFDADRTPQQRVLVRTYYLVCRKEYRDCQVSDGARLELLELLTARLAALNGSQVPYGEQRLLTHLCESMLSRYADQTGQSPEADDFVEAMRTYAASAKEADCLAAAARGWLDLLDSPVTSPAAPADAVRLMGHWDPLARLEASGYLARSMAVPPGASEEAWRLLGDVRDEVRAAAATALGYAGDSESDRIIRQLVRTLLTDRGVVVQAAASAALSARADQAGQAIQPLLDAFSPPAGRAEPMPNRADSILQALASLAGQATPRQRGAMLALAIRKLDAAPHGSLALLAGLGPSARPAVEDIRVYRRRADRFERQYIDRHVLPAIEFGSTTRQAG